MNLSKVYLPMLMMMIGATAAPPVFAEGYAHEFSVSLPVRTVIGGGSNSKQSVDYTYYPSAVAPSDQPFAEAAFFARSPYVSLALSGASGDVDEGSKKEWGLALKGRFALPDQPYFADAAFSRRALSSAPYLLLSPNKIETTIRTFGLTAGMYTATSTEVDFSITRGDWSIEYVADYSALSVNLHGKTVWAVTEHINAALELTLSKTSADVGSESVKSTGFIVKGTTYFSRTLSASLEFGRIPSENNPGTEYLFEDLSVTWFIEPEVMISLDLPFNLIEKISGKDYHDRNASLRIAQRL